MKKFIILSFFTLFTIVTFSCDGLVDILTSEAPAITVTGPVTGGKGKIWSATATDLDAYSYTEKEYFFEGEANAYSMQGSLTQDGKWTLMESGKAHFKSRMIVRRPEDASTFNGTVIIEWFNVSGGADGDPGFMYNAQEILREGYVWVGVSAQKVGIEGGGFALMTGVPTLKDYDPERYGSLTHPGDAYSYDIFTQAAKAVRGAGEVDVLEGLNPERLIAYGESQSAGRLVAYVNGVHPLVKIYDGFFIHSRGASGSSFENEGMNLNTMRLAERQPVRIRTDLEEAVFQFQTEGDVLSFYTARQPDTDRIRTWEVAGTAHADDYILSFNNTNQALGELDDIASSLGCEDVNSGPQHLVIKAALHALNQWMTNEIAPPSGELIQFDQDGQALRDEHGNVLGGIRTPAVDVPISTLLPRGGNGSLSLENIMCGLFGKTIPFTPEKLLELYPDHADYVAKVNASARETREAGFLLEPEEQAIVAEAHAAAVPY